MKHFILKRGTEKELENYKSKMAEGEIVALLDKHTLAFYFEKNNVKLLNFDESVSIEKADTLINSIQKFLQQSR